MVRTISLSLLCFHFYLLFFPEFPITFTHYSPCYHLLFLLYSLIFLVTMRSTVYLVTDKWVYPVWLRLILPRNSSQFFLSSYIFCYYFAVWLYFIAFSYFSFQKFFYYACKHPIIPALFLPNLQPIILKIMPA